MKQKKPIQQPYETPENYFDGFNARVMQKIEKSKHNKSGLKWHLNRKWIYAVAATLALAVIGVGLYKVLQKPANPENKMVIIHKTENAPDTAVTESTKMAEEFVIQHWEQEAATQQEAAVVEVPKNREELSLEEELEAEGLIVREVETDWLDENEILP